MAAAFDSVGIGSYHMMPSGDPPPEPRNADPYSILDMTHRKCPSCGTDLDPKQGRCPNCGTKIVHPLMKACLIVGAILGVLIVLLFGACVTYLLRGGLFR